MIGKVADVILMAEACAEGHCIVGLSFLTASCNGAPCKVIPVKKEKHFISKHQTRVVTKLPLLFMESVRQGGAKMSRIQMAFTSRQPIKFGHKQPAGQMQMYANWSHTVGFHRYICR